MFHAGYPWSKRGWHGLGDRLFAGVFPDSRCGCRGWLRMPAPVCRYGGAMGTLWGRHTKPRGIVPCIREIDELDKKLGADPIVTCRYSGLIALPYQAP